VSLPLVRPFLVVLAVLSCGRSSTTSVPHDASAATVSSSAPSERADTDESRDLRERLVAKIEAGGLPWEEGPAWDPRVLAALRRVPRHRFVDAPSLQTAYADRPLPIGHDQTISQPRIVAIMTQALELTGRERVLEIGTGSGYQAAVLALLAKEVDSIEIVEPLGVVAQNRLRGLGYANVNVRIGDGYRGWPEKAPFDRVLLTAAPPEVPAALVAQLREGGILVAPVGAEGQVQRLVRWRKRPGGELDKEELGLVRFVPMVPGSK
jgi:protein-L-isoaspartate(D-aspartate) O-methyltransferase